MTGTSIFRRLAILGAAAALVSLSTGCSSDADTAAAASASGTAGQVVRMWIEPDLAECEGVGPMECMQVAYTEDGTPELFYGTIEGFEFVEGTAYVVDVHVTDVASPPADGSSLAYTLVDVVSEEPAQ